MLNQYTLTGNLGRDPVTIQRADQLISWQSDANIKQLYLRYKDNPLIKWKDSIKKVVGLKVPTEPGMDR
jgi:hypothetical protein